MGRPRTKPENDTILVRSIEAGFGDPSFKNKRTRD